MHMLALGAVGLTLYAPVGWLCDRGSCGGGICRKCTLSWTHQRPQSTGPLCRIAGIAVPSLILAGAIRDESPSLAKPA